MSLPKIIASCAIRASNHGDTHGGLYLVDLQSEKYDMVLNWTQKIDYHGRGAERGLRGIIKYKNNIIVAASSNLIILNKDFVILNIIENKYLKYIHEICLHDDVVWITSTGYDAIIRYSLNKDCFVESYQLNKDGRATIFNPNEDNAISHRDLFHLNSIVSYKNKVYFCGVDMNYISTLDENLMLKTFAPVPSGTHNAQPIKDDKIIMNNTPIHKIQLSSKNGIVLKQANVRKLNKNELENKDLDEKIAQQPFARGMLCYKDYIITGSSPAMLSVYDFNSFNKIKEIIMNRDIKYTIHGICLY